MNLTPLAIALQGIGYGAHLAAVQGLADAAGGTDTIVCVSIDSAEAFGLPRIGAARGAFRVSRPVPIMRTPHTLRGVGGLASAQAFGRPRIVPGNLSPQARRRKDEAELLLIF